MDWLNYHHLHYFWVVAREGSVTAACDVLHLSQPTISGQIRELERAMKAPLFEKSGRGLALTETGRAVFRPSGGSSWTWSAAARSGSRCGSGSGWWTSSRS